MAETLKLEKLESTLYFFYLSTRRDLTVLVPVEHHYPCQSLICRLFYVIFLWTRLVVNSLLNSWYRQTFLFLTLIRRTHNEHLVRFTSTTDYWLSFSIFDLRKDKKNKFYINLQFYVIMTCICVKESPVCCTIKAQLWLSGWNIVHNTCAV